jgi:heme/copper-type cytochrome/quinol oxidase subunit 3
MRSGNISIWFFIGVLLTIYGALIAAYGVFEEVTGQLANVVLKELHAPLWWGAAMLALGLFYGIKFRPGRKA